MLCKVFHKFRNCLGLKVNHPNSQLFCTGMTDKQITKIVQATGFNLGLLLILQEEY